MAPTMLAIDGGGVRGIIALELLYKLEVALNVPHRMWEFFDLVVGTSAGGLIALDLCVSGGTVQTSMHRFEEFAHRVFRKQPNRCCSICSRLYETISRLTNDSKYDSTELEGVVKEVFGTRNTLCDGGIQALSHTKLGIMATTVGTSQLRIFTSYNGIKRPLNHENYKILRHEDSELEPKLWEVARCTTAAPGYFTPKSLPGFGGLQDGGMRANNPTEAGLWELAMIWPENPQPNLVLSVGTGFAKAPTHELLQRRGFWLDGFMPRILGAFLASPCLHGQNSWLALLNRLDNDSREAFVRLNIEFESEEPALDDTKQLPLLHDLARNSKIDYIPLRNKLWALSFFFEITALPKFGSGSYTCYGVVRSRFDDVRPVLTAICRQYNNLSIAVDGCPEIELSTEQCCAQCGSLRFPVQFDVKRLEDTMDIVLRFEEGIRHSICGLPTSTRRVIDLQKAWFGDHTSTWSLSADECCVKTRKRKNTTDDRGAAKRSKTMS
ncbi:hypothetical protein LTS08_008758 [Lithohypha guttulata]|uniref:PNPLA domain-containing protein n=1 Tax=Lithohypha guttulata TaxID=1690604 RepID=A0AAN7PH95_9EURO|nr:hypothetical protein LTR05_008751 [Lithohypha guttulata]KAK5094075.1 hypothetical protein LTS08_008758 [Lithohypha guttulata]